MSGSDDLRGDVPSQAFAKLNAVGRSRDEDQQP
jgi:hypothetical protein